MKEFAKYLIILVVIVFVIGSIGYIFNSSRMDEAYNSNIRLEYAKSQNTSCLFVESNQFNNL